MLDKPRQALQGGGLNTVMVKLPAFPGTGLHRCPHVLDLTQLVADFEGGPFEEVVTERCAGLQGILRARACELAEITPISLGEMAPMLDRAWEAKGAAADRAGLCPAKPLPSHSRTFPACEKSARGEHDLQHEPEGPAI